MIGKGKILLRDIRFFIAMFPKQLRLDKFLNPPPPQKKRRKKKKKEKKKRR